jgi:hypothetical protein
LAPAVPQPPAPQLENTTDRRSPGQRIRTGPEDSDFDEDLDDVGPAWLVLPDGTEELLKAFEWDDQKRGQKARERERLPHFRDG